MQGNSFEEMCNAGLALVKEHATLFSLESTLAKQSVLPFIISIVCALILCLTLWCTVLVSFFFICFALLHNVAASIGIVFLIQVVLLCWMIFLIKQYKARLAFKQTRASFKDYWGTTHEH